MSNTCIMCGTPTQNAKYCSRACVYASDEWRANMRGPRVNSLIVIKNQRKAQQLLDMVDGKSTFDEYIVRLGWELCTNSYTRLSRVFRMLRLEGKVTVKRIGKHRIYRRVDNGD